MKHARLNMNTQAILTGRHQVGSEKGTTGADTYVGTSFADRFMAGGHFNGTGALVAGRGAQVSYDRAQAMLLGDVNGDGVAAGDFVF